MADGGDQALIAALRRAAGLGDGPARRMDHGMSGDVVLRLDGPRPCYAKIGDPARRISVHELQRETAALRWLDGRVGAPGVVWAGQVTGRPTLVSAGLPGVALHALAPDQAEAGAIAAIEAMTALHTLPITTCPFDERLAVKLAESARRLAEGEVDLANLDAGRQGWTAADLAAELVARRPAGEDLVVTHGDACWPNFILGPEGRAGIIDLGRFGVADRHQDLALFIRSAAFNFPDLPATALIDEHYRLAVVDPEKLEFYRLLDEFY
jgi:aminoglycoside 3'-phosphotransferase-2